MAALKGTLQKPFYKEWYNLVYKWDFASWNEATKSSVINWQVYLEIKENPELTPAGRHDNPYILDNHSMFPITVAVTVTQGGTTETFEPTNDALRLEATTWVLCSGTKTIVSEADYTVPVEVNLTSVHADFFYPESPVRHSPNVTLTGSFTLAGKTSRVPSITSVTANLTDETVPVVSFSRLDSEYITSVAVRMCFSDSNQVIATRTVDLSSTECTLTLSSAEKNTLLSKLNSGETITYVSFYVENVLAGQTYTSKAVSRQLTYINYLPVANPILYDNNQVTRNLTGDSGKLIRGYSDVYFNLQAQGRKGAGILGTVIWNGSQYKYTSVGTLDNVTSNDFNYRITDTRNFTTTGYEIFTVEDGSFVEYVPLTCSITNTPLTAEGYLTITISGKYWDGYFGAKTNSLKMQYHYALGGGQFTSSPLTQITPQPDANNNYSYTFTIGGLNYKSQYRLYVTVQDELEVIDSPTIVVAAGEPLFDWGKDDFNFNIPVNFSQGFTQPLSALKQIWNGNYQMIGGQSIEFNDETVSSQANGIVLVFTPYDPSTGLANDEKLMSFFVSKKSVQVMPRKMHTFYLISGADFGTIGAKSVYIADEKISGYATNDDTGSKNGITYANNKFVLRYVLGV